MWFLLLLLQYGYASVDHYTYRKVFLQPRLCYAFRLIVAPRVAACVESAPAVLGLLSDFFCSVRCRTFASRLLPSTAAGCCTLSRRRALLLSKIRWASSSALAITN